METRVCNKCGIEKDLKDAFRKSSISKSGVQNYRNKCKRCYADERKIIESDPKVKKKLKERYRVWANKNKDKISERRAVYWEENKEIIKVKHKEWLKNNPNKVRAKQKQWLEENKETWLKYRSNYEKRRREDDPLFSVAQRIRGSLVKAFSRNGYNKGGKSENIIGCSYEYLLSHIESQFLDGMTWDNREDWDIDHIIPLAAAYNEYELYALAHYSNLQPLWREINIIKSDDYDPKDKEEYLDWYSKNVAKK